MPVLTLSAFSGLTACVARSETASLPSSLSDAEFWSLSERLSEPSGTFAHSENLVSNERHYAQTIRLLRPAGGVYIGVGPEQNFSYIARVRPEMAFIIDIRRENWNLHLLYKALFELSADRAEFVSRLFSRDRPAGLTPTTSVQTLFSEYAGAARSQRLYDETARLARERLLANHRFPLSPGDFSSIDYALNAFSADGPDIHYGRSRESEAAGPSYSFLMSATDLYGQARSYLSSEETFAFVKELHARNMIVPVVGDFGGPTTIRAVADYIGQRGSFVSTFYGSNVEVYLNQQQRVAFCGSLATLPHGVLSWFITNKGIRPLRTKLKYCLPPEGRRNDG